MCSDQAKVITDKLPPEQKKQADNFVGGATNVATGVAGTAGGAVKGVLDTTANTVGLSTICLGFDLHRGILCEYSETLCAGEKRTFTQTSLLISIGAHADN